MTWKELANAVHNLEPHEIVAQMEEDNENAKAQHQTIANLLRQCSMAGLEGALGRMHIATSMQSAPLTYPVPQAPPSIQTNRAQAWTPGPHTDAQRLVDVRSKALPIQPDTATGRVAYEAQVAMWHSMHGSMTGPTKLRPYPLTPGSAPVASGECWTCGQPYHRPVACSKAAVLELEIKWHRIAGSIERAARIGRGTAPINVNTVTTTSVDIANTEELARHDQTIVEENTMLWEWICAMETASQGKAEGSSD